MRPVELPTPHLMVRTPIRGDGARYARYYSQNREFLQAFSPTFEPGMFSASEWESSIPIIQHQVENGTAVRFVLVQGDEIVGVANLTQLSRSPGFSATLGYTLSEGHQGQGLMFEALRVILQWAFDIKNLHRIAANYMPRNERSGRLLRKLGFQVEGFARDYLLINGKWEDHILTAKINPKWKCVDGGR